MRVRHVALLVTILCLCAVGCMESDAMVGPVGLSGGVEAAGGIATCPAGTYLFAWNGENVSGTDYACLDSGASEEQATNADVDFTGTDYFLVNAISDDFTWDNTPEKIDDEIGTMCVDFYVLDDGDIGDNAVFESVLTANEDFISIKVSSTDAIYAYIEGSNVGLNFITTAGGSVVAATWYRLCFSWQTGVAGNDIAISLVADGNAQSWSEQDDDLSAWASAPDNITWGNLQANNLVADGIRMRDMAIMNTYKATDPLE